MPTKRTRNPKDLTDYDLRGLRRSVKDLEMCMARVLAALPSASRLGAIPEVATLATVVGKLDRLIAIAVRK